MWNIKENLTAKLKSIADEKDSQKAIQFILIYKLKLNRKLK